MFYKLASGYLAKVISIVSIFIFVPLYLRYVGLENYSIISLGLIVAGILSVLDTGFTSALIRELSREDTSYERKQNAFKALEITYIAIAILLNIIIYLASNFIASNFVNSTQVSKEVILIALMLIGVEASVQMMMRFYIGGLVGLERQIIANVLHIVWSLFRNGLVVVIIYISPNISSFFEWQVLCAVFYALVARYLLGRSLGVHLNIILPANEIKEFLKTIWPFVSGLFAISIVAALSTQVDKLVIAKFLEIEVLGYYTLAISFAGGLTALGSPIANVLLPRMTSLFSSHCVGEARILYKKFCLLISTLIFSVASNLFFLSNDIMLSWTGSEEIARNARVYLAIATISYSMIAASVMPYVVALANGHTKTHALLGVASLVLTLPGYYFVVQKYGGVGVAAVFLIQQSITTVIFTTYIAKKFLDLDYWNSLVLPMLVPMFIIFIVAWLLNGYFVLTFDGRLSHFVKISLLMLATLTISSALFLATVYLRKRKLDALGTAAVSKS